MKKPALRILRIILATIMIMLLTFLFLNLSNNTYFSFLSKIQFIPALLAVNFAVIAVMLAVTFILGRVYCSVICPLGIVQDIINWLTGKINRKKTNRFTYATPKNILRYSVLVIFAIAIISGIAGFVALLDPYSAAGRIMTDIFRPAVIACNNGLASLFNTTFGHESYVFVNSVSLSVAIITFVVVAFLAFRSGRTWCNTICPVGSFLGLFSRFSILKVRIDEDKCNACLLCGKKCKASCIDSQNHYIDYSRCVACFDCIDNCRQGAIHYTSRSSKKDQAAGKVNPQADNDKSAGESRKQFIAVSALALLAVPKLLAQKKIDNVVSTLTAKEPVKRQTAVSPFGSISHKHLQETCTSCHLCISKCPDNVLKPSVTEYGLGGVMQPVMDFSKGYCDYECTVCGDVCPAGAIKKFTVDEKHGMQIGLAVFNKNNCVVFRDGVECGNCKEHCPAQAIKLVPDYNNPLPLVQGAPAPEKTPRYKMYPEVEAALCIGCGSCEYHCPARPFSAIYVEGLEVHNM